MAPKTRVQRDWPAVVAAQSASGLSGLAYCRERGISTGLFYRWRRRCQSEAVAGFVEVEARPTPSSPTGVTMVYDDGWRVELALDFDTTTLQRVLSCIVDRVACSP